MLGAHRTGEMATQGRLRATDELAACVGIAELCPGLRCSAVWRRKRRRSKPSEAIETVLPVEIQTGGVNVVSGAPPPKDERVNVTGHTWRAVVGDEYHQPAAGAAVASIAALGYDVAELRREPMNEYDPNAVAVMYRGERIGYLSSAVAELLQPSLAAVAERDTAAVCAIKSDPSASIMHVWVARRG